MSDNSERSGYHRRVERILDEMKLNYMSEEPFPPYKVDILLTAAWAAIEVDGPFHKAKHDKVRDQYLLEHYKLPILRLKQKVLTRKSYIEEEVMKFFETHLDSAPERKALWLTSQP